MTTGADRYRVVRFVFAGRVSDCGGEGRPWTLVYDGNCGVCGKAVRAIERWDRRHGSSFSPRRTRAYRPVPMDSAEAYADAMQLIGPGGRTSQGAMQSRSCFEFLPRGWVFGWVFKLPLVGWLADKFYRWFARNRYRFGCGDALSGRGIEAGLRVISGAQGESALATT